MKTIYNTFIKMKSQSDCDMMKQLCIDYNLPIGKYESSFELIKNIGYVFFHYSENSKAFYIGDNFYNFKEVTKQEFTELLQPTN